MALFAVFAVDPTLAVGVVSVLTAIVTTAGGIAVAVINNRREATNAAQAASDAESEKASQDIERANAARLALRDEQIAALEWKVRNREAKIAELELRLATELANRNQSGGPHEPTF